MDNKTTLNVRSSAAEFLIFSLQEEADTIEVLYQNENLWLTQKMMGQLFDVESNTITYHLKEIFNSGELEREATTRKFRVVQKEGSRSVNRDYAISHQTAAEIIYSRADYKQEHMGLTSWKNSPDGKVLKSDVSIAKNYLFNSDFDKMILDINSDKM